MLLLCLPASLRIVLEMHCFTSRLQQDQELFNPGTKIALNLFLIGINGTQIMMITLYTDDEDRHYDDDRFIHR